MRNQDVGSLFDIANQEGQVDVVKVVITASSGMDALHIHSRAQLWKKQNADKPVIALAMGLKGQVSRVLNNVMLLLSCPGRHQTASK